MCITNLLVLLPKYRKFFFSCRYFANRYLQKYSTNNCLKICCVTFKRLPEHINCMIVNSLQSKLHANHEFKKKPLNCRNHGRNFISSGKISPI